MPNENNLKTFIAKYVNEVENYLNIEVKNEMVLFFKIVLAMPLSQLDIILQEQFYISHFVILANTILLFL